MLAARLALENGGAVPVGALIDGLWGEDAPAEAAGALQALVSRLRKALRGVGTVELGAGGYRLPEARLDAQRFEDLVRQGRKDLAAGRAEAAASLLREALSLWRGEALGDVAEAPFVRAVAARLDDLRAAAMEDRFDAELRIGRYADILGELETAAEENQLSERLAALRMRALTAAGRQSDALAVYEEMRARLDDELGIDPSAELRETHLALLRGELETPVARREPTVNRLPARLTSFIGRDTELERLSRLLTDSRLVTIVGPGGAGKTRLSLEAMDRYTSGPVFFVPLAEVGAPDQLADAVAGALGSSDERRADQATRLAELLNVGAAVLVLDNCEHLIEAAAGLAAHLLDRLPHLRILATSREPLAITGETLWHLDPLAIPAGIPEPAAAQQFSAIQLFIDRATSVRPDFILDDRTVAPVVEICRQLDGVPLALELAAAKLRSMTVDQIARRLDDRFRLLTSGSRTALPRQRTLLALVEWSWDLLEDPERVLARRLSLFPGGATAEALEAICSTPDLPADDIIYILDTLVEKSIVTRSADDNPRYRMLETVRAYAADQLARSGDNLTTRFTTHFLALAEEHEPLLRTGEQLRAIAVFDAEHANMAAALRITLNSASAPVPAVGMTAPEADRAARFVRALFWYWGIRGMSTQFETALAEVPRFGHALPAATRTALRVIRTMAGGGGAELAAAEALLAESEHTGALHFHPALPLWASLLASSTGNAELGERQLELALRWPDPWVRASAHFARDIALTGSGAQPAGADARREALLGFGTVGDRWGLGMALLAQGRDHSLRGDHESAIAAFSRAVAVASELGMEDDILSSRTELANERMRCGDLPAALRDIESAQRLATDLGYTRLAALLLLLRAESHRRAGDPARADGELDHLEQLLERLPKATAQFAAHRILLARMANRLTAGEAPQARALLPNVLSGLGAGGDAGAAAHSTARVAELLAELEFLEDAPESAATTLGTTVVIRGIFDSGEPELHTLETKLVTRLGRKVFDAAYRRGTDLPREEALNRLTAAQPMTTP
ncbi:BTAD domain-containing putative transcriptional regulator [Nocardia sp. NPDC127526]|uniref:BTAD domain-containing putative transcriptional regulator n=1 Tax=Nocardia sp. NPDC127526 TaxID=3345393 RepID=UPI003644F83E